MYALHLATSLRIALFCGLLAFYAGCAQESGAAAADVAGQQDTAGQLGDVATDASAADSAPGDAATAADAAVDSKNGGTADAGTTDAGTPDAGTTDAGTPDAGMTDAGMTDAGTTDAGASKLRWFATCGDPVCSGYKPKKGVGLCTTEKAGVACTSTDSKCDPKNQCNAILICAEKDPKQGPSGCPISARRFKTAIHYLTAAAEANLRDELLRLPLATWRYRRSVRTRRSLGFILEDAPALPATDLGRERVDLYALSTMAIAAVKTQQREMREMRRQTAALRRETAELRKEMAALRRRMTASPATAAR